MSSRHRQDARSSALLVVALSLAAVWLAWMLNRAALGQPTHAAARDRAPAIVSLTPAITETLFAIGAGSDVVGVSDYCALPPGGPPPARTGTGITPDYERIARLAPTLIVTDRGRGARHEQLSVLAPTVALPWHGLGQVLSSIRRLGELTRHEAEAEELAERMRRRLEVEPRPDAPRVLVAHGTPIQDAGQVWYIQPDCLHGAALRAAGGRNAMPRREARPPHLSLEHLLEVDPDIIVILAGPGYEDAAARERLRYGFRQLRDLGAVREDRIGIIQGPAVFATGPSILDLVEPLADEIKRLGATR